MKDASTTHLPADQALPHSQVNVLLVDDEPANLTVLEAILADMGANLIPARSGQEALDQLQQTEFAAVLLDVQMRGMNGLETAKLIRSRDECRHTPIIFITGFDDASLVEEAYSLGAVDYLVKPLVPVILRAKVWGFIELFQKTEQVKRQAALLQEIERRRFNEQMAAENLRLQESERRFRTLTSLAPVGIFQTDAAGMCLFVNERWCEMAGMSPEQAQGPGWVQALHPDDKQRVSTAWDEATKTSREFTSEYRFRTPQGKTTWLHGTAVALHGDSRKVMGYIGTVTDITERKRSEELLRNSESQLRLVTDHAPVFISQFDADRRFRFVNQGYAARFGMSPAEFVGKSLIELLGREAYESFSAHIDTVLRGERVEYEAEVPYKQFGPRIMHCAYVPERNSANEVIGWVAVLTDVTERRRADDALRESEQRFARFMQHLPGLAWIKDLNGRYIYVNNAAEAAFQKSKDQLYGHSDEEIFPPDTAVIFRENDQSALASDAGVQVIETLTDQQGILRHSLVSKFGIPGPNGKPTLVGGMAIDMTERLDAEEQLRLHARHKDEFLATLAHELRNPLAPISNALHLLRVASDNKGVLEQARVMMERQLHHMVRLVDDLLDVSRITRNKLELRKEWVELETVVHNAVETSRPLLDAAAHSLTVTLPSAPVLIDADPVRLAQIFGNLLNNAAKYTQHGGNVWLSATVEDGMAVVNVRDSGIGISPEKLGSIFEMFVQLHDSAKRVQGGLGIGLTLVKQLTEMHGGTVEAQSAGPGTGTTFIVRLPVVPISPSVTNSSNAGASHSKPIRQQRILVADDNPDSVESLALMLRAMGHEVHTARDGKEAVDVASKVRPDVALLDIGMPNMTGDVAARHIRNEPWGQKMLLVAITGWGQDDDRRRTQEAGFNHHLVKPADPKDIARILEDPDFRPATG